MTVTPTEPDPVDPDPVDPVEPVEPDTDPDADSVSPSEDG